jgi:iron complex transport system substrate-binding protein
MAAPLFQRVFAALFSFALLFSSSFVYADVVVTDDGQRTVSLKKPAQRIISLAPHVTELVFAVGAGRFLVGVSEYSDYPEAAKKIASIGNVFALDLERVLALKPDLVIIWGTGNAKFLAQKLRNNHIPVFESEPHNYEEIASSMERIAILSGTKIEGRQAATQFRQRLQQLSSYYRLKENQTPISVFHQLNKSPLMTINQEHFISKAISLCGGRNVFSELKDLSSTITTEAVLFANPEVILTSDNDNNKIANDWNSFSNLTAVKKQNLFAIKGDWIHRFGPRVLDGTEQLCKYLSEARKKP